MTTSDTAWWKGALPAAGWLRSYHHDWFRLDLVAGITLAAYLLPAALGDASLANLPPQAGLYGCLFGGLVFWIFCSSRHTAISVTSQSPGAISVRFTVNWPPFSRCPSNPPPNLTSFISWP